MWAMWSHGVKWVKKNSKWLLKYVLQMTSYRLNSFFLSKFSYSQVNQLSKDCDNAETVIIKMSSLKLRLQTTSSWRNKLVSTQFLKITVIDKTGIKGKKMNDKKNFWVILWFEVRLKLYFVVKTARLFVLHWLVCSSFWLAASYCSQITKWLETFFKTFKNLRQPIKSKLVCVDEELLSHHKEIYNIHV